MEVFLVPYAKLPNDSESTTMVDTERGGKVEILLTDSDDPRNIGRGRSSVVLKSDVVEGIVAIARSELLRAVPTWRFLTGPGILLSSVGTLLDYELSEPVDVIETFISHNWGCDSTMKWLALLYHFHHRAIWLIAGALLVIIEMLTLKFEWTTFSWWQPLASGDVVHVGTFGVAPFFLPLLLGALFLAAPFWVPTFLVPNGACFLDKCSISQTDEELKKASIRQLGGYIANSKKFLLVCDPSYLERLW
jgi:hypothetical protein